MSLPDDIIKSIRKVIGKQKHHLHEPFFFGKNAIFCSKFFGVLCLKERVFFYHRITENTLRQKPI